MDQVTELFEDSTSRYVIGATVVAIAAGAVLYNQYSKSSPARSVAPFSDEELEEESRKAKKTEVAAAGKTKKPSKSSRLMRTA